MQLSDLDWRVRTALGASGIVFFFLVGLGAGTYFDGAPADLSSGAVAVAANSAPVEHSLPAAAPAATADRAAPAPVSEPAPALPPVAQAQPITPPPMPLPDETAAAAAPPQATVQPAAPAPAPQEKTTAAAPPPAHSAVPAKVALVVPPPEAKPAAAPAPVKPAVLHPPQSRPTAPAATASGPFRIQFGAFRHEENARRLSEAVSTPAMKVSVTRGKDHRGRLLYYVRSPEFSEFARALAAAWDAQNAAQKLHFDEPITYLIQRVPAVEAAAAPSGTAELAAGTR